MSLLEEPIRQYVQSLIPQATEVVWTQASGPRASLPFVSLRLDSNETSKHADRLPVDENGNQPVITQNDWKVTVEYYAASGAYDAMVAFRTATFRMSNRSLLAPWSIASREDVVNVSAVLDRAINEDRASVQISLRSALLDLDPVGYIETVNASGTLTGSVTTVPVNVTVTED